MAEAATTTQVTTPAAAVTVTSATPAPVAPVEPAAPEAPSGAVPEYEGPAEPPEAPQAPSDLPPENMAPGRLTVLATPVGRTVCSFISMCRGHHGWLFFLYALMLVAVIVLVWIAVEGHLTFNNSAIACTVIIAVLLFFMLVHWYSQIKGVIPQCAGMNLGLQASFGFGAGANANASGSGSGSGAAGVSASGSGSGANAGGNSNNNRTRRQR